MGRWSDTHEPQALMEGFAPDPSEVAPSAFSSNYDPSLGQIGLYELFINCLRHPYELCPMLTASMINLRT
jgi:hypothetical protein